MYKIILPTVLGLSFNGDVVSEQLIYNSQLMTLQRAIPIIVASQEQEPDTNLMAKERTRILDREQEKELLEEKNQAIKDSYYLGEFKLTAYCNCSICCGQWSGGPCFNGEYPTEGWTVAVDKNVIPINSEILIDCDWFGGEHLFKAQDTGSAIIGNRIDIYMDNHNECLDFGVRYADVYYDYRNELVEIIEE